MPYQFAKLPSRKFEPIHILFKVYESTYYLTPSSTLVIIILFKIFQFYKLKGILIFILIGISFITSEVKYFSCLLAIQISPFLCNLPNHVSTVFF